jgi:FdrA protein
MSESAVVNRVRRSFYLDSVALMRLSQRAAALPGVDAAALMIGSESNKSVMSEAGLLAEEGRSAGANDLIIAVRAESMEIGEAALGEAESYLDSSSLRGGEAGQAGEVSPRSLDTAIGALPGASLAVISVPGEFAAEEARKALRRGLHVMIFSDNVTVADEISLKEEARERGLFLMGPDCGTAIIGGVPVAFANEVPRGGVGIVSASGTGLQEVSCLIARGGGGVSHGIGTGGRDLSEAVGGLMTLSAIDALDEDEGTSRIVLISKPPAREVAGKIVERVRRSSKPFTICIFGLEEMALPPNARLVPTLLAAAEDALGKTFAVSGAAEKTAREAATRLARERTLILGLFAGGTLCAEAQVVLCAAGESVHSNAPIPGASTVVEGEESHDHILLDLGADEYTVGRPHPMLDPTVRNELMADALAAPEVAVVLIDLVIGHGAHEDPAGSIADALAAAGSHAAWVVASVCGTEADPQVYSRQVEKLEEAGVIVASSNAQAARLALQIARRGAGVDEKEAG